MAIDTKIEWADSTCNPTMGCDGCELWNRKAGVLDCYAGTLTDRYGGSNKGFPAKFEEPQIFSGRVEKALKWKDLTGTDRPEKPWLNGMPRIIFVGDMGDTFTESLGDDYTWLTDLVEKMGDSPHQWLMLTKRPQRMATFSKRIGALPKNVWPGTTVTSQRTVTRCEHLINVIGGGPRFVSAEPLWSEVDFTPYFGCRGIDWVITGGQSGRNANPMNPDWPMSIHWQCRTAGASYFHKQNGEFVDEFHPAAEGWPNDRYDDTFVTLHRQYPGGEVVDYEGVYMAPVGKKRAGRLLDGVEHNGMPEVMR